MKSNLVANRMLLESKKFLEHTIINSKTFFFLILTIRTVRQQFGNKIAVRKGLKSYRCNILIR